MADPIQILRTSKDRDALQQAAIELIRTRDAKKLASLRDFLSDPAFLARLDDVNTPNVKTRRLSAVFRELTNYPSPASAELSLRLGSDSRFLSDPDRKALLLPALAAVRPMSEASAQFFGKANAEGYYSINAPLLARNGSPRAVELFRKMIEDGSVPSARRVDALHSSIVPVRTNVAIIGVAERLISAKLDPDVLAGLIESMFDYQPRRWYGVARSMPQPPPWSGASAEALDRLSKLAGSASGINGLPPALVEAVRASKREIDSLRSRKKDG